MLDLGSIEYMEARQQFEDDLRQSMADDVLIRDEVLESGEILEYWYSVDDQSTFTVHKDPEV